MYNGLASKVYDVLASYAQQQGYTLVLDVAQQQNPVLYASDSTNITKAVIDAYNVKSGVPAPPAQPPSAPRRQAGCQSSRGPLRTKRQQSSQRPRTAGPLCLQE